MATRILLPHTKLGDGMRFNAERKAGDRLKFAVGLSPTSCRGTSGFPVDAGRMSGSGHAPRGKASIAVASRGGGRCPLPGGPRRNARVVAGGWGASVSWGEGRRGFGPLVRVSRQDRFMSSALERLAELVRQAESKTRTQKLGVETRQAAERLAVAEDRMRRADRQLQEVRPARLRDLEKADSDEALLKELMKKLRAVLCQSGADPAARGRAANRRRAGRDRQPPPREPDRTGRHRQGGRRRAPRAARRPRSVSGLTP